MSATRIGMAPTRLPPEARAWLLRMATRGHVLCSRVDSRGGRLLTRVFDGLQRVLVDLAIAEQKAQAAERALAAAQVRIGELTRQLRSESFDVPTVKRDSGLQLIEEAEFRKEGPTSVFNVPTGVR